MSSTAKRAPPKAISGVLFSQPTRYGRLKASISSRLIAPTHSHSRRSIRRSSVVSGSTAIRPPNMLAAAHDAPPGPPRQRERRYAAHRCADEVRQWAVHYLDGMRPWRVDGHADQRAVDPLHRHTLAI